MLWSSHKIEISQMTQSDYKRRDLLLHAATLSTGTFAAGYATWGLIRSMLPAEDVVAEQRQFEELISDARTVDLRELPERNYDTFVAFGLPVAIVHRSKAGISAAEAVVAKNLRDPLARNANLPTDAAATDENRRATPDGKFILYSLVCPQQNCVVVKGHLKWTCGCDGSEFDLNGLVRTGPAAQNLSVPVFRVLDPNTLEFRPAPA